MNAYARQHQLPQQPFQQPPHQQKTPQQPSHQHTQHPIAELRDVAQFRRFHELLAADWLQPSSPFEPSELPQPQSLDELRWNYAFYTDDKAALEAAHARQIVELPTRRARDPSYRLGKSVTYDPASRGHARSYLTVDQCWQHTVRENGPGRCTGITLRINETDGQGCRTTNFTRPRAFFVDADSLASRDATIAFFRSRELWPTMVVQSSTDEKMHAYWVLTAAARSLVSWEEWSGMQRALAKVCQSDASLDDPPQAMRVPGTLNWKNPANPRPVRLLYDSGPLYTLEEFRARSALNSAASAKRRQQSRSRCGPLLNTRGEKVRPSPLSLKRIAAGLSTHKNFTDGVVDSVDIRAAAAVCPALAESFATGGANHSEPLWFTMLSLAVFDHDPLGCAAAMSCAHPRYTPIETVAKLEQVQAAQRQQDLGWTSCRAIAQHHPACAGCYYRTGTTGPLSIASMTVGTR